MEWLRRFDCFERITHECCAHKVNTLRSGVIEYYGFQNRVLIIREGQGGEEASRRLRPSSR